MVLHRKEPLFILRDKVRVLRQLGQKGLAGLKGVGYWEESSEVVFERLQPICQHFLVNMSETFRESLRYQIEDLCKRLAENKV